MSSFRSPLTLRRKEKGFVKDGYWVEGFVTESTFTASVQPLTPREVEQLPEGRRDSDPFWLFTSTELKVVNVDGIKNPDIVVIDGEFYEVDKVGKWQNNVINHYKCLVYKVAAATQQGATGIFSALGTSTPSTEAAFAAYKV